MFNLNLLIMKKQILTVLVAIVFAATGMAQDATTVLNKMDDVIYAPKDQKVSIKMIITDRANRQKIRKAISLQKGNTYRLMKFTEPAAQKGIAFLSLPNNVMYVYLPAFKKERRIAGGLKKQNFAGTDFSYDDLESIPYAEKYNAKSVKVTGDSYVLEVTPKDLKNSAYSKLIITLYKNNYYPKEVQYFDKNRKLIKKLTNKKIEKKQGYWTATDFVMETIAKKTKTEMIFESITFDNNLSDEDFSVRKLSQF